MHGSFHGNWRPELPSLCMHSDVFIRSGFTNLYSQKKHILASPHGGNSWAPFFFYTKGLDVAPETKESIPQWPAMQEGWTHPMQAAGGIAMKHRWPKVPGLKCVDWSHMGIRVILVMPRRAIWVWSCQTTEEMSLLMDKTPPLPTDDTVREGSWGRHMGGSKEDQPRISQKLQDQ